MEKKLKTIAIITCTLLIATSLSSVADPISNSSGLNNFEVKIVFSNNNISSNSLLVKYSFERPIVENVSINGTVYNTVIMKDAPSGGNLGDPRLPAKGAHILLPPGTKVNGITVTPGEMVYLGSDFTVEPVGEPVPLSQISSAPLPTRNEAIYSSMNLFPDELFTEVGTYSFRGYEILVLMLYPVQYLPASGELFCYKDIKITVEITENDGINPLFRGPGEDKSEVMNKVDNPSVISTYTEILSQPVYFLPNYDLLILTTDSLAGAFQELKNYHDNNSVSTVIKTLTDVGGTGSPEDIRNYIRNAYNNWSIDYVLIGGDDDIIPAKDLYVNSNTKPPVEQYYMPSDFYYACLDGTFNYDGDDRWGERQDGDGGGDVDLVAEVYVGRAPVGNTLEVNNFVNKTVGYLETNHNYLKKTLWVGEIMGWGGVAEWGGNYKDEIIGGSSNHGYTTVGVPTGEDGYNISTLYDRDWAENGWPQPHMGPLGPTGGWPRSELISRINNGVHFINHLGHGAISTAMKISEGDIRNLITNNEYFFIYSQTCSAGHFDNIDCWAEHMTVKTSHSAFAAIMNAREGWGTYHITDGPSQRFDREFWDAVFGENIPVLGKANQDSKEDNLYRINQPFMRWCYYGLNLFGDPTVALKPPLRDNVGVQIIDVPDHVKSSEMIYVNATVFNNGRNDETDVLVSFRIDGTEGNSLSIPFFESQAAQHISFTWITPDEPGGYTMTVNVTIPGVTENFYGDNEITKAVVVGVQNIDTGECFGTIQEALDASHTLDGHTIVVPSGIYRENVMITKNISLMGLNRDTTIIRGNRFSTNVIHVKDTSFVSVSGFTIRNGINGVCVQSSENVSISNNEICNNMLGIHITDYSSNVNIHYNKIHNNDLRELAIPRNMTVRPLRYNRTDIQPIRLHIGGIKLENTSNNSVTNNEIIHNYKGLIVDSGSNDNLIVYNNFNNTQNAYDAGSDNQWDSGYFDEFQFCGGNWWSDYNGSDEFCGFEQDLNGNDGIGDTPYNISGGSNSQDRYPLMEPLEPYSGFSGSSSGSGLVINIDSNEAFEEIQKAIDDPDTFNGHTLQVFGGVYYENVKINKTINLIGLNRDNTIIDGNESNNVVEISVDWVNISGFTIKNSGYYSEIEAGIQVSSDYNTISSNNFTNNFVGIYLQDSDHNTITGNTIVNNDYGIAMEMSSINTLTGNNIQNNRNHGIILFASDDNIIYHNNFIKNDPNAYDECSNTWDDEISKGNYWGDFEFNPGYPDSYEILPDGNNVDHYPLESPV